LKFKNQAKEIHQDIFLIESFLDQEILNKYQTQLNAFKEEDWYAHGNIEPNDNVIDFWNGRGSPDIIDADLHDPILNLVAPDYWIYHHTNFVRVKAQEVAPTQVNNEYFINNTPIIADYKVSWYLGDFEGGAIIFPKLPFIYQPKANDLLIWKIDPEYVHKSSVVTSGTKFAYTDLLIYHKGYFIA